jgi:hypothetical protein
MYLWFRFFVLSAIERLRTIVKKFKKCLICDKAIHLIKINVDLMQYLARQFVNLEYEIDFAKEVLAKFKKNSYFDNASLCREHLARMVNLEGFEYWTQMYKFSHFWSIYAANNGITEMDKMYFTTIEYFESNNIVPTLGNSEHRWFMDSNSYCNIPVNLKGEWIIKKYIGNTRDQGNMNGPDFIYKNLTTRKTIGLEIFELNPTSFVFDRKVRDIHNVVKKIREQINTKRGGSIERNISTLNREIDKKVEKWNKYVPTDEKYIGVVINSGMIDEVYYILSQSIKENEKINGLFNGVFFL